MIFISAGHNTGGLKPDPGAVANGHTEAKLTIEIRDLVVKELRKDNSLKIVTDNDDERLGEYLSRIKTGNGSVVLEFHFDAASPTATGTTIFIEAEADRLDKAFAKEMSVKIWDKVLSGQYAWDDVKVGWQEYKIVGIDYILAIIEK